MKQKILLTGSCSFLLSNFIRKCTYEKVDYSFVSIDKTNEQTIHSLYFNKNHEFYVADILDPHILNVIFKTEKPDIVIHGAALTFPDSSVLKTSSYLETNVVGTQNVIKASIDHSVSKFIYLSTAQVYGNTEGACELTPPKPLNPYALSKYMGEQLVLQANFLHKLPYLITRVSEVYGQRQTSEHLVPSLIETILSKNIPCVMDQGSDMRDWMYVGDHSLALLELLKSNVQNEIFNIGSKERLSVLELTKKVCEAMDIASEDIEFIQSRHPSVEPFNMINTNKFKHIFEAKTRTKEGLAATVEWYKNNSWWFRE